MRLLLKFLRLPRKDRRLFIRALFLLGFLRTAIRLLPFRALHSFIKRTTRNCIKKQNITQPEVDRIIWAVETASRYIPHVTCFIEALTAWYLLTRRGHPVKLRIGVKKDKIGKFEAHAWVEGNGRVLIGRLPDHTKYTPFQLFSKDNT